MVQVSVTPTSIDLTFGSDVTFVDHALEILRTLLLHQGLRDPTALLLACRELLRNAVVHGNRNRPDLMVLLRIARLDVGRYRIEVEDQGPGFDLDAVTGAGVPGASTRAAPHGYEILRSLATGMSSQGRGNRIAVILDVSG